ncbi:MAG: GxxExxY protein [Planctomycetota bacterium]
MKHEELTSKIIGAAIDVHRELGPGLLESAYEVCMFKELEARGLAVMAQVPVPVIYKGDRLDAGFRIDLLIEDQIVVELKAVEQLLPVHTAQLITYMKLSHHEVGLLMNFNVPVLRDGIKRIVND